MSMVVNSPDDIASDKNKCSQKLSPTVSLKYTQSRKKEHGSQYENKVIKRVSFNFVSNMGEQMVHMFTISILSSE